MAETPPPAGQVLPTSAGQEDEFLTRFETARAVASNGNVIPFSGRR
jgi:hypothetical protein